jgi:hypothetical protein
MGRTPRGVPGRVALDGAPRASVDSAHAPAIRRSRAPLIPWWAPISASPRRGALHSAALSSAGGECASTSDTPCRDVLRAFRRAARHRDRLPSCLVKGRSSERSRAPSIDECPLGPPPSFRNTSALEREPATGARAWPPVTRLPTLFRRLAPEREVARPRPLPDALRARALLGHAPLVDFCNQNDLQARPTDLETRCAWRPLGFHRAPRPQHRSAFRWGRTGFPARFQRSGAE